MAAGPMREMRGRKGAGWEAENTPLPAPIPGLSDSGPVFIGKSSKTPTAAPPAVETTHKVKVAPAKKPRRSYSPFLLIAMGGSLVGLVFVGLRPSERPPNPPPREPTTSVPVVLPPPVQPEQPQQAPKLPLDPPSLPLVSVPEPEAPKEGLPVEPKGPEPSDPKGKARHHRNGTRHGPDPGKVAAKGTPALSADKSLSSQPVPQLTREILRTTMLRAEPGLLSCVREGWGLDVSLGITVAKTGAVQRAEVQGPFAQTLTAKCMTQRLSQLRFPPFTQGADKQLFWYLHLPEAEVPTARDRRKRRGT